MYVGTARNTRKGVQKPAPVAFLSYRGEVQEDRAWAGSPNIAMNGSLSVIRQTSPFFKENDENSPVEVSASAFSEKINGNILLPLAPL